MNTTFDFLPQLANTTNFFSALSKGMTNFGARVQAGWSKEHNADDTHSTIHATGKIYERRRTVPQGEWSVEPYDSTDFSVVGSGNSWAVPAPNAASYERNLLIYRLIGGSCKVNFDIQGTTLTIATATNDVFIRVPSNMIPFAGAGTGMRFLSTVTVLNSGTVYSAVAFVDSRNQVITIRNQAANYVSSSDFSISGQFEFQIQE